MSESNGFINLKIFQKQHLIGKGSFGKVYKVMNKRTGAFFAAKISLVELSEENQSETMNLKREINIISELNHPSILRFIGYSPINFKQKPKPVIVTELSSNGSLDTILDLERRSLSPKLWDDTKKLINIYGIASAMSYLHSHNIIHRDLKPANILEDDYLFPKIADFGLSKIYHQNTSSKTSQSLASIKGTPAFMAPECIEKNEYTKAGDVFSFAIIVYEIITLEEPYQNLSIPSLLYQVARQGYRPEFRYPIAKCYKNLITKCWSEDPNERPSFTEIVSELKNNPEFIIDGIDKKEYFEYISLIENSDISFDPSKKFKKITISDSSELVSEHDLLPIDFDFSKIKGFYNLSKDFQETFINTLSNPNQKLVKSITLHTEELSILYSNNSLNLSDFIKLLQYFEEIIIEIKYPINNFESIFNIISDEWSLTMNTLKINVIISDIKSIGGYLKKKAIPFSVTIEPNTLTEIGYYAFNDCTSLTQITIPSTVNSIGGGAFSDCITLTQFTIPPSVNKIRKYTFRDCSSLKYISIPSSVAEIERSAFNGCSSLVEIIIPSSVKKIRENAFKGCSSLTEIIIPSSVTRIESNCFERCTSLKLVTIPSSVTSIDESAFERCSSLEKIIIPSSITDIGQNAFERCSELKIFSIPTSLSAISESCFTRCSSLEEIVIPSSVEVIGNEAFAECSSLVKITIPSSVKKINSSAFAGCSSLTEITIPSSVTFIGAKTFRGCSSLVKIIINSSIDSIYESFCNGCSSLKEIEIPSSVNFIGYCAFRGCSSLDKITIPHIVTEIGFYAFGGCSSLKEISIPSSVKSIGSNAFSGCTSIDQISFQSPSSLKSIGASAFSGCSSIKKISIPPSVSSIEELAFSGCSSLDKLEIHSSDIKFGSSILNDAPSLSEVLVHSNLFDEMNKKKKDYSIDELCNVKIIDE